MKRVSALLLAAFGMPVSVGTADPACIGPYSVCMAACTTELMAERCMQRCMTDRDRCVVLNLPRRVAEHGPLAEAPERRPTVIPRSNNATPWGQRRY